MGQPKRKISYSISSPIRKEIDELTLKYRMKYSEYCTKIVVDLKSSEKLQKEFKKFVKFWQLETNVEKHKNPVKWNYTDQIVTLSLPEETTKMINDLHWGFEIRHASEFIRYLIHFFYTRESKA